MRLDIAFSTFDPAGLDLPTFFSGRAPTFASEIDLVSLLNFRVMLGLDVRLYFERCIGSFLIFMPGNLVQFPNIATSSKDLSSGPSLTTPYESFYLFRLQYKRKMPRDGSSAVSTETSFE